MKPNIIFLVIDSFRVDFCGTNAVETPNIDSLIKNGVFFDHAISSSDYTISAIQSFFTGQYPIGCGKTKEEYHELLSPENNSLSLLKEEGYTLYATIPELLHTLGIGEYFNDKNIVFDKSKNIHNGLGQIITKKLDEIVRKEPWFYYIHLLDLHRPCEVLPELKHLKHIERYGNNLKTIDRWLGKFLQKINLNNTLVILTADHGDYLSEKTDDGVIETGLKHETKSTIKKFIPSNLKPMIHNKKLSLFRKLRATKVKAPHEKRAINIRPMKDRFLFDDFVRVPLIISGFSIKPRSVVSQQISSIDLMPTILEIIGSNKPIKSDGKSFVEIFQGNDINPRQTYMENAILWTEVKSSNPSVGIRTDNYKYFHSLNHPEKNIHLYDLKNDPFEDNNIANENSDIVKQYEEILQKIIKNSTKKIETETLDLDEEKKVEQELKKLGYLD